MLGLVYLSSFIEYSEKCPYCSKIIVGSTESQVKYNLKIHIDAKHKTEVNKNDT